MRDLEGPPHRPPPGAAVLAAPASRGAHDTPRQQRGRYALRSAARARGSAQVALYLRVLLTATFQGSWPRPLTFSGQLPFCWQVTGPSPRRATETLPCSGQVRAGENEAVPSARRQQVLVEAQPHGLPKPMRVAGRGRRQTPWAPGREGLTGAKEGQPVAAE